LATSSILRIREDIGSGVVGVIPRKSGEDLFILKLNNILWWKNKLKKII
jgi:hypothetical protein